MNHDLRLALCRSITARAHLAGAEAAELGRLVREARALIPEPPDLTDAFAHPGGIEGATKEFQAVWLPAWDAYKLAWRCAAAARRRYWREVAAAQALVGHRWEAAERLGVEP
jgi:hypothetical protein